MRRARRRAARSVVGGLLAAALAGGMAQAGASAKPRPVLESSNWRVEINTVQTYSEAGDAQAFDRATVVALSDGSTLQMQAWAREESYALERGLPRPSRVFDGSAAYAFAASSTTDVRITCLFGEAEYTASGSAQGKLTVSFKDGEASPLLAPFLGAASFLSLSAGTGFAKGALGFEVSGDLQYEEAAGIAESVGDDEANVGGAVSLPGLELSYTPHVGAGTHPGAVAKDGTATKSGKTFAFKIQNHLSSSLKADDSLIGRATSEVETTLKHTVDISAEGCRRDEFARVATLRLRIFTRPARRGGLESVAVVAIAERDEKTGHVFRRTEVVGPTGRVFSRTNRTVLSKFGWGPPALHWGVGKTLKAAGAAERLRPPGRLGVKKGARATYRLEARDQRLKQIERLAFRVIQADPKTGRVVLDASARFADSRADSAKMPLDVFDGRGGIRGILIPAGARAGARVYGVGRVTAVRGDVVTVEYRERGRRIVGTYDRDTGWLLELVGGNPARPDFTLARVPGATS